jgi:hypothetical protein
MPNWGEGRNRSAGDSILSNMKYWGFLVAKLMAAAALLWGGRLILLKLAPAPDTFMYIRPRNPFGFDLGYTFLMWGYWLLATGLLWGIIWDQRYRCRECLRRLRMPVRTGSWTNVLFGAPRTEYICTYGHDTLIVAELQITGHQNPDWEPHEDIWKELFAEAKK